MSEDIEREYHDRLASLYEDLRRQGFRFPLLEDQVEFLVRNRSELLDALRELVAAGDYWLKADDDVKAMLRFGDADKAARAAVKKAEGPVKKAEGR